MATIQPITIAAICAISTLLTPIAMPGAEAPRQSQRLTTDHLEEALKVTVPVVLCIDDKPGAGGQPSGQAYAKAAASGYRSILTLRNEKDGVDPLRERALVERQKMRYFNIPIAPNTPRAAQADEFLALVRDQKNHPMLINCAFADRVAPLIMIFRIVEQGWSEEKALEEAALTGVSKDTLKKFARAYFAQRKAGSN